eukprot:CAMPEP_0196670902 /NCGR_PEP_ID=MMETSP1090-20130531/1500_1 /TAXON_ID=37098 /ORGANISM="Isochrysis sp, Strain CCMP1244" /LENGTH=154 /DNA_ID=CAMNT_0042008525 /DNA_START=234 /DNA_END=695 /DNA_ORIENTATION=+
MSSDDCGWSAGARGGRRGGGGGESGGRRSGGGLRDRMCVGEGAVRLSVSSWLRHHSSVTISSPREGGSAEQQDGSDCGGASERERGGGGRGGRRVAAAAAAAVRGEREATGGDGETAPNMDHALSPHACLHRGTEARRRARLRGWNTGRGGGAG